MENLNQDDIGPIDNIVNNYVNSVLKKTFPNIWDPSYGIDNINNSTTITLFPELINESLKGSKYYYRRKKKIFIHYTNLNSLLNIIREGQIRLYDLSSLDDPQELSYSTNALELLDIETGDIEEQKKKIFILSMNEFKEEAKLNNFINWRLYGQDGSGIGIVLEISEKDYDYHSHQHICKVFYNKDDLKDLENLVNLSNEFFDKQDENIKLLNLYQDLLARFLAFHKINIYNPENEVRLIEYIENPDYLDETINFDLKNLKERRYINIKLFSEISKKDPFLYSLDIKLSKVILGYKYSRSNKRDIEEIVNKISDKSLGYQIPVEITRLKKFFK